FWTSAPPCRAGRRAGPHPSTPGTGRRCTTRQADVRDGRFQIQVAEIGARRGALLNSVSLALVLAPGRGGQARRIRPSCVREPAVALRTAGDYLADFHGYESTARWL